MQSFIKSLEHERDNKMTPDRVKKIREMKGIFPTLSEVDNPIFDDFVSSGDLFAKQTEDGGVAIIETDEMPISTGEPSASKKADEPSEFDQGYEKGFDEGFQQAIMNSQEEIGMRDQMLEQMQGQLEAVQGQKSEDVDATMKSFFDLKEEYLSGVEADVKNLIVQISEKIVRQKLSEDESVLNLINDALGAFSDHDQVVIRVHPENYDAVKNQEESIKQEFPTLEINVLDDHTISNGCIVETKDSQFDLQLDTQLEKLREILAEL
jgi:flagellar biosynthesis/type III secretory pathway protein FliH